MVDMKGPQVSPSTKARYFSPRLLEKMRCVTDAPVTVVQAPSGFGKTTLLKHCLGHACSLWWVGDSGDLETSWMRLCDLLGKIDPEAGRKLRALGFPDRSTSPHVVQVISCLRPSFPCVLVLDDFQHIQAKLPQAVVSALASYEREDLHLVIVTQVEDPYQRSFLKQHGVCYIGQDDLRFSPRDIRAYFGLCGVKVSQKCAEELYRYTGGWIVALNHIMLRAKKGKGLSPGRGPVSLMEGLVWNDLSPEGRSVLLYSALFPHVTLEQLQAFKETVHLEIELLDLLERTPFISYDPHSGTYSPSTIMREMLLRRLEVTDRGARTLCYRGAGDWYARIGDVQKALSYYLKVKDYESVLSLPLTKLIFARVEGRSFTSLAADMVAECPYDIKRRNPLGLLRVAYALIGAGRKDLVDSLMEEIKTVIEQVEDHKERNLLLGEWALVSAFAQFPDVLKMEALLRQAADRIGSKCRTLPSDEPFAFGTPSAALFLSKPGNMEGELQALGNLAGHLAVLTGEHNGAHALFQAECSFYKCEFDEVGSLCHQAYYLADAGKQWAIGAGAVNLAAIAAFKRGSSAYVHGARAWEGLRGDDATRPWAEDLLQAHHCIEMGLTHPIASWIKEGKMPFPDAPLWLEVCLRCAHLWVLLLEGDYARLLGAAKAALVQIESTGLLIAEIYVNLFAAVGYLKVGRKDQAFFHVLEALTKALPDHIYLPLTRFEYLLQELLGEAFSALGTKRPEVTVTREETRGDGLGLLSGYVSVKQSPPYRLTQREMEVATLASLGMSNKEIALELFVSESTVKYHLRAVFSKLDINRRSKLKGLLGE